MLKIILNRHLPLRIRFIRLFKYLAILHGAKTGWKERYKKLFSIHPKYRKPIEKVAEEMHSSSWKSFSNNVNLATFRVCANISGLTNPDIIPEEIFVADIEPTLNNRVFAEFYNVKSFYNEWFPKGLFPLDYFHKIGDEYLDANLKKLSNDELALLINNIDYPVVMKPNIDSYGGKGVLFPPNGVELYDLAMNSRDFVVQEKIKQHYFFNQFSPSGINSIRVYVYKSVSDDNWRFLDSALRMGIGGSLDNETAGGIVCSIKENGVLNGFAVDKYGKKYVNHPDTGMAFNVEVPYFEILKTTAVSVAQRIFYARLVGLDLCLDIHSKWRLLEINVFGTTIRFSQYAGYPFFGNFTDEVKNYCLENHWAMK